MDLAELKAQNLAEEEKLAESPQDTDDELDTDEGEEESEELEQSAETDEKVEPEEGDQKDTDKAELEDWQKADDEDADPTFDNSDMAAVRRKYKGKMEKAEEGHVDEVSKLNARIEQLEKGKPAPVKSAPNRDDFDDDLSYLESRQDWKHEQSTATTAATQASEVTQSRQNDANRETEELVDQHYLRAHELVADDKNTITEEVFQNADLVVRKTVEAMRPNDGDRIIDSFISRLGKGSEKVMYSLGVNRAKLSKFESLLKSDPSGLEASMYLGELKSGLNAPSKRKTNAPAPASIANGDKQTTGSMKAAKKAYDKAGNPQERFDAKKKAKAAGVDTSGW